MNQEIKWKICEQKWHKYWKNWIVFMAIELSILCYSNDYFLKWKMKLIKIKKLRERELFIWLKNHHYRRIKQLYKYKSVIKLAFLGDISGAAQELG